MERLTTWSLADTNLPAGCFIMKHPAGRFKTPLLWLRSLQVLFGLAQLVVVCIGLSEAVRTANSIRDTSPWDDDTIRNGDSAMITTVVTVIMTGVVLVVTVASIVYSTVWHYYTACPAARDRDCVSSWRSECQHYNCDLGWDVFWSVLWGLWFIVVCAGVGRAPSGSSVAIAVFSAVVACLFIATALVSSRVRDALRHAQCGQAGHKDVECIGRIGPKQQEWV